MNLFHLETMCLIACGRVEGRAAVPVFEKAPEAKGNELERGLNHEGGAEEVITVLQSRFQRL